jgi:hypothetical protein
MKQLIIYYKDGTKDWFDPCESIIISNGYNEYPIDPELIDSLEIIDLEE